MSKYLVLAALLFSTVAVGCPLEGIWEIDTLRSSAEFLDGREHISEKDEGFVGAQRAIRWEFTCDLSRLWIRIDDSESFALDSETYYAWKEIEESALIISELTVGGPTSYRIDFASDGCFEVFNAVHKFNQTWCKVE